jgi:hypothetical protein
MNDLFPLTSRYHGLGTTELQTADGTPIVYLRRRLVPQPERFQTMQVHSVAGGDRLDNLAAHYFGDPELFWRLCDANRALRPGELTERVGREIRITLPEDMRGPVL